MNDKNLIFFIFKMQLDFKTQCDDKVEGNLDINI